MKLARLCAVIMVGLIGCKDSGMNPPDPATGIPAKLAFGVQPSRAVENQPLAPAITIFVQDGAGNTILGDTRTVTLSFGNNAGGGTLAGTLTAAAVNGVVTFNNITVDKLGYGYTLVASSSPALTSAASGSFDILPAALYSFQQNVKPVLVSSGCTSCHGGTSGLRVDTVPNLLNGGIQYGPAVIAGNSGASPIIAKVSGIPTKGVRMPQGGPYLSETTIWVIRVWIDQGANNN